MRTLSNYITESTKKSIIDALNDLCDLLNNKDIKNGRIVCNTIGKGVDFFSETYNRPLLSVATGQDGSSLLYINTETMENKIDRINSRWFYDRIIEWFKKYDATIVFDRTNLYMYLYLGDDKNHRAKILVDKFAYQIFMSVVLNDIKNPAEIK